MRTRLPIVLVAALLSLGLVAHAREAGAQVVDTAEARRLFDTGVQLLGDRRFADAAASFERSIAIVERASTLFNLGVAYRGMNRCRQASATFEHFLAIADDRRQIHNANVLLAQVRACVARVTVVTSGGATELLVDGAASPGGDGTRTIELDPGHHTFEAHRVGYQPARLERDLARGATETVALDVSRAPIPATLVVEANDPDAIIRVDGEPLGTGQNTVQTTAGPHRVEVTYRGEPTQHRSVDCAPGSRVVASFNQRPSGGVATRWWFWTGVGLLVSGAVVGAVVLASHDEDPYRGTWGFAIAAVRVGP